MKPQTPNPLQDEQDDGFDAWLDDDEERAGMREIRVKFQSGWIDLPADLPVIALIPILQRTGWKIRWNHQMGVIQIH